MDESKKPSEVLDLNDEDIEKYLKAHPEKAKELGETLIELDQSTKVADERAKDLSSLNRFVYRVDGEFEKTCLLQRVF